MIKQTAEIAQLGQFVPKFAELNDDILFGEIWSREDKLSLRDCSLIAVVAFRKDILDFNLQAHLINAKKSRISKKKRTKLLHMQRFMQDGQMLGQPLGNQENI